MSRRFRGLRQPAIRWLFVPAAVLALTLSASTSRAGLILNTGPDNTGTDNVLFANGVTGNPIVADLQNTGFMVNFGSTESNLVQQGSGQAAISAADGALNNISVFLPDAATFSKIVFNAVGQGPQTGIGAATLTVLTNEGSFVFNSSTVPIFTLDANGSNFYTLLTTTGTTLIQKVTLDVTTPGLKDLEQVRIGGAQVAAVPEPATLTSAAMAGLMVAGLAWRRRRIAA